MSGCERWLPDSAIFDGKIDANLSRAVENAYKNWFKTPLRLTGISSLEFKQGRWAESYSAWRSDVGDMSIFLGDKGRQFLLGELLNINLAKKKLNPADRKFVDTLMDGFMRDTCKTVSQFFGDHAAEALFKKDSQLTQIPSRQGYLFNMISNNGMPLWHAMVDRGLVIEKRLSLTKNRDRSSLDLHPRQSGLDKQRLSLGAFTGKAKITLAELENLSLGDVIVLDQSTEQSLCTTINGTVCADISCHIEQSNHLLQLKIAT